MIQRKVYLHVGAPKTGTTYLQDRLALNAATLADHGVHYPTGMPLGDPSLFQFRAALDLLDKEWGGPGEKAAGKWDQLVRRVRRVKGGQSVVISHEILAPATHAQIDKLRRDLDVVDRHGRGSTELHIVYSARDLDRQVPAGWQEAIKQGQAWSYKNFCTKTLQRDSWFGRAFDVPTVLSAWSAGLPAEQVHVVTVPQRGTTPREELFHRYCRAFRIDPSWAPRETDRVNPSLGMAETQMLRRLNRRLQRTQTIAGTHDYLIREVIAERELAGRTSDPVRLPPDMYAWADQETERWIEWLQLSGVEIVGSLDDLRPVRPPADVEWKNPDRPGSRKLLNAALDALAVMTREAARRPDPDQQLVARLRTRRRVLRDR